MSNAATHIDLTSPTTDSTLQLAISKWLGASSTSTPSGQVAVDRTASAIARPKRWVGSSASARTAAAAALAVRDLDRYATFPRGWDGYDGEVLQPGAIRRAVAVVQALAESFLDAQTEPSEITPGPISDGRVDVEAACDGRRLIVTLEAGAEEVGIFYDDGGAPSEKLVRWDSDDLGRWIRRLTGEDRMSAVVRDAPQSAVPREAVALGLQG